MSTAKYGIVPRAQWPACLHQGPEGALVGVFVGGCVARGVGSRFRAKAHAHTLAGDPHQGWLCVLSYKRLTDTHLLLHELAHVLSGEGHTDGWRRMLITIGGHLDRTAILQDYHKRTKTYRDTKRPHLGRAHHPECPCGHAQEKERAA